MKTQIIIDRQRLNEHLPAIVVVTDDGPQYCDEVIVRDESGSEVARVTGVAMGGEPVGSARVWLETTMNTELVRSK